MQHLLALTALLALLSPLGHAQLYRRLCENQGTCLNCGHYRFSYYKCRSTEDCMGGEQCTADGFCCPQPLDQQFPNAPLSSAEVQSVYANRDQLVTCPDGSSWMRKCTTDLDCGFNDEICADGKCCAACQHRRRQVLDDLPTNNVFGVYLPQCDLDGRQYRPHQCRIATDECWCVNGFGRVIGLLPSGTPDAAASCLSMRNVLAESIEARQYELMNKGEEVAARDPVLHETRLSVQHSPEGLRESRIMCALLRSGACDKDDATVQHILLTQFSDPTPQPPISCGPNEEYVDCFDPCQPTCSSGLQEPCPLDNCQGGCHCKSGFIRVGSNPKSVCVALSQCAQETVSGEHCSDPLKEFTSCGSSCPVACATRNVPRENCNEKCVPGCFCKIPYIIEDDKDPVHSKCVLPAQCRGMLLDATPTRLSPPHQSFDAYSHPYSPLSSRTSSEALQFPVSVNYLNALSVPYSDVAPSRPRAYQCTDPLKNFQLCGSSCPVGCNSRVGGLCGLQCVSGCFCRSPYILQDSTNPDSGCVLPENCGTAVPPQQVCLDPRKEWTSCFSPYCAPSCANQKGICRLNTCTPGCACREPYILRDTSDSNSRCVLPIECPSQTLCDDPLKEHRACASSCPMGCNNKNPKTCTPCASGCFCKIGYIFEDAINWRSSRCIPVNQCPGLTNVLPSGIAVITATKAADKCPAITADVSGRACNLDKDCPPSQKCCPPSSFAAPEISQHRCACSDPHAVWTPCGSLCPEYCGQPSIPVCSSTCNPGCHCASGYVRSRNDVTAPCVSRAQCLLAPSQDTGEVPPAPKNPFEEERNVATVHLDNQNGDVSGKFRVARNADGRLKLWGFVYDLPPGEHALIVHQFGDTSNSCVNIGPAFKGGDGDNKSSIIGNMKRGNNTVAEISKLLDWSTESVIAGRSLAIHAASAEEWDSEDANKTVLACGTIGLISN